MSNFIRRLLDGVDGQPLITDAEMHEAMVIEPQPVAGLIDRTLGSVGGAIENACRQEDRLVAEIADREELLRQTRVTRRAFELAKAELMAGQAK